MTSAYTNAVKPLSLNKLKNRKGRYESKDEILASDSESYFTETET